MYLHLNTLCKILFLNTFYKYFKYFLLHDDLHDTVLLTPYNSKTILIGDELDYWNKRCISWDSYVTCVTFVVTTQDQNTKYF